MKRNLPTPTLIGFFIISYSFLILELLVSRVMSAVAWYHFAFMAISIALFGMTLGSVIVFFFKNSFITHIRRVLAVCSILFSVSCLVLLLTIAYKPIFYALAGTWQLKYDLKNIFLVFGAITIPFICLGVCISLIFTAFAASANRIYAVNLIASALGCLLFIPFINHFEAHNTFIVIAFFGLLAAFCFLGFSVRGRMKMLVTILSCVTVAFLSTNIQMNLVDFELIKGLRDYPNTIYRNWNAFSYLRVSQSPDKIPFGWGFAPKKVPEILDMQIDQLYLDIDGNAGTTMVRFDGDVSKLKFLKYDVTSLPHYLARDADMLVIGVGAGRDILTGLTFEQKSITGVEINEGILYILNTLYGDFSGQLAQNPKVRFVNDEARSYITSSKKKYDLIQISLIDTFAASLAGAYALSENGLYTQEAFSIYMGHLSDSGFLNVAYWYYPNQPQYLLRLTGMATKALEEMGVTDVRKHIVIIHQSIPQLATGVASLLVKRGELTDEELAKVKGFCDEMGFDVILSPHFAKEDAFAKMSSPGELDAFASQYRWNVVPSSDNKPFFFFFERLGLNYILQLFGTFELGAVSILFYLLALMTVLTLVFIVVPLWRSSKTAGGPVALFFPFSLYFALIGLAFMLVEISQMTRLSLFLGHPIYSLAVVLFSLLLSSGIGSYILGRIDRHESVSFYLGLFMVWAISYAMVTPIALEYFSRFSIAVRLLIAVLMIGPLGFFMGSFLPQGVRLVDSSQGSGTVALLWGLNGAMSVIGSILAMIFLITFGIKVTFLLGVGLYALAILIFLRLKQFVACRPCP